MKRKLMITALCFAFAMTLMSCGSKAESSSLDEETQQSIGNDMESDAEAAGSALDSLDDTIQSAADAAAESAQESSSK